MHVILQLSTFLSTFYRDAFNTLKGISPKFSHTSTLSYITRCYSRYISAIFFQYFFSMWDPCLPRIGLFCYTCGNIKQTMQDAIIGISLFRFILRDTAKGVIFLEI